MLQVLPLQFHLQDFLSSQITDNNILLQSFNSLDILISAELSLILRKFKLHQDNWHGR